MNKRYEKRRIQMNCEVLDDCARIYRRGWKMGKKNEKIPTVKFTARLPSSRAALVLFGLKVSSRENHDDDVDVPYYAFFCGFAAISYSSHRSHHSETPVCATRCGWRWMFGTYIEFTTNRSHATNTPIPTFSNTMKRWAYAYPVRLCVHWIHNAPPCFCWLLAFICYFSLQWRLQPTAST